MLLKAANLRNLNALLPVSYEYHQAVRCLVYFSMGWSPLLPLQVRGLAVTLLKQLCVPSAHVCFRLLDQLQALLPEAASAGNSRHMLLMPSRLPCQIFTHASHEVGTVHLQHVCSWPELACEASTFAYRNTLCMNLTAQADLRF